MMRMVWKTSDYKEMRDVAYNMSGKSWNKLTIKSASQNILTFINM